MWWRSAFRALSAGEAQIARRISTESERDGSSNEPLVGIFDLTPPSRRPPSARLDRAAVQGCGEGFIPRVHVGFETVGDGAVGGGKRPRREISAEYGQYLGYCSGVRCWDLSELSTHQRSDFDERR